MRGFILALIAIVLGAGAAIAQIGIPFPGPGTVHSAGGGGAIAFVAASDMGSNSGAGTFSASYTTGSGSNRLLIACITGALAGPGAGDNITGVTYNSVSMTLGQKMQPNGARWIYLYYLLNPASGSNTLAITQSSADYIIVSAADYTGVKQSAQPDATATNEGVGTANLTTAITIANANSWVMTCWSSGVGQAGSLITGTNSIKRAYDHAFQNGAYFDSDAALGTGSNNVVIDYTPLGTANGANVLVSFQPD